MLDSQNPKRPKMRKMPYENTLDVPKDLYFHGKPYTPHVWPSIFTGDICIHPDIKKIEISPHRRSIRMVLHKIGIRWRREGFNIRAASTDPTIREPSWLMWQPSVKRTVLDNFNTFKWNIPAVCPAWIMGGSWEYIYQQYEAFKVLAEALPRYTYDVGAIYTDIIDKYAHHLKPLNTLYAEISDLAFRASKLTDVMVVSDHGCIDGDHTEYAYLGCTKPIKATSVIEVKKDIEKILGE